MEDDQQFCLRWNNHQSTIIQNFDTLLESGTLVDCTLAAEGKYLKAHKVVLSACSPYFEGLLSEHYDKHPVFILKDVKFKELKAMMDYMYRGEVNISQDQLTALLKAAESLQIKGLSDSRTDKGTGNTGNTTTGGSKDNTRPAKTASSTAAASASAAAVDIPHSSSGLTIEKNSKVPRQSIQQVSVSDQLENSASPQLRGHSSREGSQSPTRKRKRLRRRSLGNDDNSMENHEASNSSDVNMTAPALGVAPVAAEEKNQADPADSIGRSALMQQLTKPADEMLQMPLEKPEPSEDMIQPKSEYQDDQESVEDLTHFDDDMNDLNEMEQDNSRAGPSHDPSQHGGIQPWHIAGDRSNASVVGAAAGPGAGDEVFLAAAEAAQAQRDSQAATPENNSVPTTPTSKNSRFSKFTTPTTRNSKAKKLTTSTTRNGGQKKLMTPSSKNTVVNGSPASNLKNNEDKSKTPISKNIIIKSTAAVSKKIIVKSLRDDDNSSPTKDNKISKKSTYLIFENNIKKSTNNSANNSEEMIVPASENKSTSSALENSIVNESITLTTDNNIVAESTASIVDNIIVNEFTGLTLENNVDDGPVPPTVENNVVDELPTSDNRSDKSEVDNDEFRGFSNKELQHSLCYLQKWDLLMARKILPKKILLRHKREANNFLKQSHTKFLCTTCSKEFARKRDLWKHVKYICGQGERFRCPYCPKYKSNVTSNVYKHIRLDHPTCRIFCIDAVTNKPFKSDAVF